MYTVYSVLLKLIRGGGVRCQTPFVFKKNLNASRSSEHPPVRGEKMSKHLGGTIGCKDKTSSWHLIGLPNNGGNIGSTVCMVITYSRVWINRVSKVLPILLVVS